MFKRILIANRGEIAVRILRACRELEIRSAVIYSEIDRSALHVRLSDEAYRVGPASAAESYLAIDKILTIARKCNADAIHPGYGFLAENPDFAEACEAAKIKLIGPSAKSMRLMGSKTEARRTAAAAGVPVVPGTTAPSRSWEEALKIGRQTGYPIALKATAGGGGKGMRVIHSETELPGAFRDASSEAQAAFKDPTLYVEKYLNNPRHIEIQLLSDSQGNFVYLGERECSIQRRHQKLIEECPSPIMTMKLREQMGTAAIKAARLAGYENAGTIEFLVDSDRNFYFLEMNARLQVEHAITEIVTGIDIVKEQIAIASGQPLSFSQTEIKMQGAALECRICAEDPDNNFFPSPGKIGALREPSGPGVRCDSGIYEGYEISMFYDSLLAKLIAYGKDRTESIARMKRSLAEYKVTGVKTTVPFFLDVLNDAKFLAGDYNTGFIEDFFKRRGPASREDLKLVATMAAVIASFENGPVTATNSKPNGNHSPWKHAGRMKALSTRL